ncbi:MAG: ribosomal-protein-alanine acetyltransferase [Rhodobacterales bacterium 65-51]|uniref:GNAT family N-acetyltransferase n=1 Tax=uncultured Gemmobacter sp. TaxID=1095917 RepID=UPI00095FA81C|nr:GNAT family N-acetyltransferase [uncultured Gemmobacter sp.]OJY35132.1 MAG: ribosomal-protein-alanine acetyltransferase [Rhodobacterales bacterium 65-51]
MTPEAMADLHARCFTTPAPWSARDMAALTEDPLCFVLTTEQGFLLGRAVAGEAELLTLAVAPEARRQGIASHLVHAFLDEARARGAETAFLEVSAKNAAALALYLRHGFAQAGLRRGYYATSDGQRIDALVLSHPLSPAAESSK